MRADLIDEKRDAARGRLLDHPAWLADRGVRVPCQSGPPHGRAAWTSDDPDEQARAAAACRSCLARAACRAYVEQYPREVGVYGAVRDRDRFHQIKERTA